MRLRVPAAALARITHAEPPPPLRRGFFDPLYAPTKALLDKGFRLYQAADWLIQNRALPQQHRGRYLNAMRVRFTRFRQPVPVSSDYHWQATLGYDSVHALPVAGGVKALCGATSGRWFATGEGARKCRICQGIVTRESITIHREKVG